MLFTANIQPAVAPHLANVSTSLTSGTTALAVIANEVIDVVVALVYIEPQGSVLLLNLHSFRHWVAGAVTVAHNVTTQVIDEVIPPITTLKPPAHSSGFGIAIAVTENFGKVNTQAVI